MQGNPLIEFLGEALRQFAEIERRMFFLAISKKTSRRLKKESGTENQTIA